MNFVALDPKSNFLNYHVIVHLTYPKNKTTNNDKFSFFDLS